MVIRIDAKNEAWIKSFVRRHKRKPRVLHISNVANNAYNNAKLLNACGIENHVIAVNDYYAMGCPEWEDADFKPEITDMTKPDWSSYNLNGFYRPEWFMQGNADLCVNYLIARCEGKSNKAKLLLKINLIYQQLPSKILYSYVSKVRRLIFIFLRWTYYALKGARKKLIFLIAQMQVILKIILFVFAGYKIFIDTLTLFLNQEEAILATNESKKNEDNKLSPISIRFFKIFIFFSFISRRFKLGSCKLVNSIGNILNTKRDVSKYDQFLIDSFKKEFPHRPDLLEDKDLQAYDHLRFRFNRLIAHYDIIIGYAYEGVYPLMANKKYFAFEHGTIRDIPYQQDTAGRLCSLVYRKAEHVFVTNTDCVASAKFLSPDKFTVINHPYDEDQSLSFKNDWQQQRNDLLHDLQADMILFHPTRQDWISGKGFADKANDVFLKAFIVLRQQGLRLGLVCCEWGANIEESKQLLDNAGVSCYVLWKKPLGIIAYTRMCMAADIVVDQFKLGAFGGVTFKALAAEAPVMTYLDLEQIYSRYAEAPPIINCQTVDEIMQQLSYWYERRSELREVGRRGRVWMKKFHNKSETINALIDQFRKHVPVNAKFLNNLSKSLGQ